MLVQVESSLQRRSLLVAARKEAGMLVAPPWLEAQGEDAGGKCKCGHDVEAHCTHSTCSSAGPGIGMECFIALQDKGFRQSACLLYWIPGHNHQTECTTASKMHSCPPGGCCSGLLTSLDRKDRDVLPSMSHRTASTNKQSN